MTMIRHSISVVSCLRRPLWRAGRIRRLLLLSAMLSVASGCVTERPAKPKLPDDKPGPWAQVQAYNCGDDQHFTMAFQGRYAWLIVPGHQVRLDYVESDRGAQYKADGITFWGIDTEASLVLPTEQHTDCKADPQRTPWEKARIQGVDFRAVGGEPAWFLEITSGQKIVLVTDAGARWQEFGAPTPQQDPKTGASIFETNNEGHDIRIQIQIRPCQDSLSGENFEARVAVTLDGQQFVGCGRNL